MPFMHLCNEGVESQYKVIAEIRGFRELGEDAAWDMVLEVNNFLVRRGIAVAGVKVSSDDQAVVVVYLADPTGSLEWEDASKVLERLGCVGMRVGWSDTANSDILWKYPC